MKKDIIKRYYDEIYYNKIRVESDGYPEYRARLVLRHLRNKGKILNVGCGRGFESREFKKAGHYVVGTDISKKVLKFSRKLQDESYLLDAQEKMPFRRDSFDTIYAGELLEHLPFPSLFLKEAYKVLKPKGKLIVIVPNIARFRNRVSILFNKLPFNEEHLHELTTEHVKKLFSDAKFKIVYMRGTKGLFRRFPSLTGELFIVAIK